MFLFPNGREWIEAAQRIVDETRVTHDHPILWQAFEKLVHQLPEIGRSRKIIGTGESRIECDSGARGAAAEFLAQDVENQRLGRSKPPRERLIASALADPGGGGSGFDGCQEGVPYFREQLCMLVAIDEVRGPAEHLGKCRKLHHQFSTDDFTIEQAKQSGAKQFGKGGKQAAVDRTKVHGQWAKWRSQRYVEADGATRSVANRSLQCADFGAADRRPHHHNGCGIETAAFDQISNTAVDRRTDAVVVGAQPDAPRRRGLVHSAAVLSPTPALFSGSTRLTVCSATK